MYRAIINRPRENISAEAFRFVSITKSGLQKSKEICKDEGILLSMSSTSLSNMGAIDEAFVELAGGLENENPLNFHYSFD